jgi:hypothetical protein
MQSVFEPLPAKKNCSILQALKNQVVESGWQAKCSACLVRYPQASKEVSRQLEAVEDTLVRAGLPTSPRVSAQLEDLEAKVCEGHSVNMRITLAVTCKLHPSSVQETVLHYSHISTWLNDASSI